jgi:hypothetical protein
MVAGKDRAALNVERSALKDDSASLFIVVTSLCICCNTRRWGMRCVLVTILLLTLVAPVFAQHGLAGREQWQPQNTTDGRDPDARLEKPVTIATAGHSAVTTLKALTKLTGVSLAVAPEDLATLGERKLVIYAEDLKLKSLLVQVLQALQECHWDVVTDKKEPIYLLHRNANMNEVINALLQQEAKRKELIACAAREAQLEEMRQALALGPEELSELEKINSRLAGDMRDIYHRALIEELLNLPVAQVDTFIETGKLELTYNNLSPRLHELVAERQRKYTEAMKDRQEIWIAHELAPASVISNTFSEIFNSYHDPADPEMNLPSTPTVDYAFFCKETADSLAGGVSWKMPLSRSAIIKLYQWSGRYQIPSPYKLAIPMALDPNLSMLSEPSHDPELLQATKLEATKPLGLEQLQQLISERTGLTVVGDYFIELSRPPYQEINKVLPLWQVLDLVALQWNCYWQKNGRCIVFYHCDWFDLLRSEIPETMLVYLRGKLRTQGQLSLDDAVTLYKQVGGQPRRSSIPHDIAAAGLTEIAFSGEWVLSIYATLSQAQSAKAFSPSGLAFTDMTAAQQALMIKYYRVPEAAQRISLHVEKTSEKNGTLIYSLFFGKTGEQRTDYRTWFKFPKLLLERSSKP